MNPTPERTPTMTATMTKLTRGFSQTQYDRYITQNIRTMTKARAKGHRDFKTWTDAEIRHAAETLARINNAGEVWR
jgi:hypothetical protein